MKLGPRRGKAIFVQLTLSLVFTYLFFLEYLPPLRHVHIPYDLQAYHYSLNDYVFQALRQGRFPEWDAALDCGLPLAGNIQAATFYPPMWLLYLANFRRPTLAYQSLEIFVFAHVWLAFVLCYLWLLDRRLAPVSAALGAGIFAFSGYMLLQLQHLGLVCCYAWLPLGLWGVDEFIASGHSRQLWKITLASALAFLAGYPPAWVVFAVCILAYAGGSWPLRWGRLPGVAGALAVSLMLSMVELLPAWEAAGLSENAPLYGAGIRTLKFFISYLVPNYFDFGLRTPVLTNFGFEFLYLGAPATLGLYYAARYARWQELLPYLTVVGVSLIAVTNPWGLVWLSIERCALLAHLVRSWYFLAGVTAAIAPMAALGIDRFFRRAAGPFRPPAGVLVTVACFWWALHLLRMPLPVGWVSLAASSITLALLASAVWLYRSAGAGWSYWLAAAMVLVVGCDYRAWGTSLRVNAAAGDLDRMCRQAGVLDGVGEKSYGEMRRHPEFRVISDLNNPFPLEFRHCGLRTPQGVDPFMPRQYRAVLGSPPGGIYSDLDAIRQKGLLRLLGVRYVLTTKDGLRSTQLAVDPDYRGMDGNSPWRVYELRDATPPYRWEMNDSRNRIERLEWQPELRSFQVHASRAGRLILVEEFYPGWEAWVDGRQVPDSIWREAFQSVWVPEGDHAVVFRFRSKTLRLGGLISVLALVGVGFWYVWARDSIETRVGAIRG